MPAECARAFWIAAPGRGEIRAEMLDPPAAGQVVVRAEYSGISRGTEALVFAGRVPVSEYERMRAPFQAGHFPAPVKYGYSSVGIVERGPAELVNRPVFALYPHQTRYVVPIESVHVLPDDVPGSRAVLAANAETALNGVWDANLDNAQRVTVVGAGTVGCLTAWIAAREARCEVELIDTNPRRESIARALGVRFAVPQGAARDAPVVIHASGSPEGLVLAMQLAAFEGTIVEMSWYGDRIVALPLGQDFHARRLTIRSSQVGSVAPTRRRDWTHRRRLARALELLREPALDLLITGESRFDDLPAVMAQLAAAPGDTLCHRITYG